MTTYHQRLLQRWNYLSIPLLCIGIGQLIFGRFEEIELHAIVWLTLILFPGTLTLHKLFPVKNFVWFSGSIPKFRITLGFITFYLISGLLTLLIIPGILRSSNWTLLDYLYYSLGWMIPLQILTIAFILRGMLNKDIELEHKKGNFKKSAQELWEMAIKNEQLTKAMCIERIKNGEISDAIFHLKSVLKGDGALGELAVLSNTYIDLSEKIKQGLVDFSVAENTKISISQSLLNLTISIKN